MFGFIKKMFIGLLSACTIGQFAESLVSNLKGPIKYVSLNNQPCQIRPEIGNINADKTLFYPFTVSVNKCGRRCNTINDPYTLVWVPSKIKKYEFKSIPFYVRVNETRFIV